ncbi:MAG TPA: ABC transporter permease [Limnochordales bacterium]
MRGFLAVAAMSFRIWWRDRGSVFWGVVFPLLLMGLIGSVFGRADSLQLTVTVVGPAPDGAPGPAAGVARALQEAMRAIPPVRLVDEPLDRALEQLRRGNRTLVIEVLPEAPPGQVARVVAYIDRSRLQTGEAALAVLRDVLARIERSMTGVPELLALETRAVSGEAFSMFDFLLPGVMAMSIMQTGLMDVTWTIAEYRDQRILKRVLATPFHPMAFLLGLLVRFTLVTLLQAVIILAVGVLVFKAKVVGSLATLVGLAALGAGVFLTMGFAISTLAPSAESASMIGSVINFPMMFLSGTFWPKEIIPEAMQPVVRALPLTPLVDSMRAVAVEGAHLGPYAGGLVYLTAWGLVALAVAAWRFRWE